MEKSDFFTSEPPDIQVGEKIRGQFNLFRFKWNSGRVGDPRNSVKPANHRGGVAQAGLAHSQANRLPRACQPNVVASQDGIREGQQHAAMGHIRPGISAHDGVEIKFSISVATARTEQGQMAGRSIFTSIERRDAGSEQLDLRVGDGAIFDRVVAHLRAGLIKFL